MLDKNSMNAPIVLFTFSRPEHTKRTIESLAENSIANESQLIVYSDAPKSESDVPLVSEVRKVLRSIEGFNSITLIERQKNFGLARNIIEGVGEVCDKFGKAIVLEDDIVTSPFFLKFMNDALEVYENNQDVWHISGWNYPIDPKGIGDAFFWRVMNCWGWATWQDRWKHFRKDAQYLINNWSKDRIWRFNLNGTIDFWSQITDNQQGLIDTWAVFWYATIFEHHGLCLNPTTSLVRNIGHDGSGSNCNGDALLMSQPVSSRRIRLPESVGESNKAISKVQRLVRRQKWSMFMEKRVDKLRRFMRIN